MENKKSLTLGITINLDNYENLRLELAGEINDDKDATMLVSDLDRILSGLGRGDVVTAERIDSYRRRVLSQTGDMEEIVATGNEGPHPKDTPQNNEKEALVGQTDVEKIQDQEMKKSSHSGSLFSYEEKDSFESPPEKEAAAEDKKDQGFEEDMVKPDLVCESCGAAITEKQRKISQMFTDKNLCEKCIQAEQGMKQ